MPDGAPGLDHEGLLDLYRAMCLARAAETHLDLLRERGHLQGNAHGWQGREAGAVGAAHALRRRDDGSGDVLAPARQASGALFSFGVELVDFFRQHLASPTGPTPARDAGVHRDDPARGIVGPVPSPGTVLEVVAGITLTFRLRAEDRVGAVFCGEATTSTGAWHEGLVFAAQQRCPLVLIVEASPDASSAPAGRNARVASCTEWAAGYGIGAESVDGADVVAVHAAVARAAGRARSGAGPQLVELRDPPAAGVGPAATDGADPQGLAAALSDPVERHRAHLLADGVAPADALDRIRSEAIDAARAAAEVALAEPALGGADAVARVYTDVAPTHPRTRREAPDPRAA